MSDKRPRRIDRFTAEQLLSGNPAARRGAPEELVALLTDAVRPAAAEELAGEPAVLAAFRAAQVTPVHHPRRRHMIKTAMAKLLTVKAAAVVAATAAGGVALAAGTGTLPDSLGVGDHAKPSAHASPSEQPRGKGSPSPSLIGLCRAYQAGAGDNPGKALENPAFRALVDAAGDTDKVTSYCTTLLAKHGDKAAKPSRSAGKPSVAASATARAPEHPTARPSEHPTGPASTPDR